MTKSSECIMAGKKGQIGKFITGFTSFLLIAILVGIFILLSGAFAKTAGAGKTSQSERVFLGMNNLLLKTVEINIKDDVNGKVEAKKQRMLVSDALIYDELNKGINIFEGLDEYFKGLVNENKGCLVIEFGGVRSYFVAYYRYGNMGIYVLKENTEKGLVLSSAAGVHKIIDFYDARGLLDKVTLSIMENNKKKSLIMNSYYGPCLEEAENAQ